jgi:acyl-CoA dehydrogenase
MPRVAFPYHADRRDLRESARTMCAAYPLDYWDQHDLDKEFVQEFFDEFVKAGFLGIMIPEEFGGGGGTMSDMAAVLEEVAAAGGGLNACSSVHVPLLCVPTILEFGTPEQKERYLRPIAEGNLFVTFGVTEPNAGTDTTKIETTATKQDDGSYLVNGAKVWNTGALRGDKVLLLARTSPQSEGRRSGEGLTLFMADLAGDSIDIKPIPKIGRNALPSCELFFRDHPVSADDVIGEVDQGFYHLLHSLNGERLLLSAEALGMGRWAIDAAVQYANERVVFDRPIGKNQAVQHPLADGYLRLLGASEVVARALDEYEERGGAAIGIIANAAKFLSTEAAFFCTDSAMQTFGGYAYAREYHIGRHWIESRLQRLAPVNNQMVLNYIAERALHLPRSY